LKARREGLGRDVGLAKKSSGVILAFITFIFLFLGLGLHGGEGSIVVAVSLNGQYYKRLKGVVVIVGVGVVVGVYHE
jgi:hypothetical protein